MRSLRNNFDMKHHEQLPNSSHCQPGPFFSGDCSEISRKTQVAERWRAVSKNEPNVAKQNFGFCFLIPSDLGRNKTGCRGDHKKGPTLCPLPTSGMLSVVASILFHVVLDDFGRWSPISDRCSSWAWGGFFVHCHWRRSRCSFKVQGSWPVHDSQGFGFTGADPPTWQGKMN